MSRPRSLLRRHSGGRVVSVVVLLFVMVAVQGSVAAPAQAQDEGSLEFLSEPPNLLVTADRDDQFFIQLPEAATCPGDTASDGWVWQTYMIPATAEPTDLLFGAGGPEPQEVGASLRLPLFSSTGTPVANKPTAAASDTVPGQIIGTFDFSFFVLAEAGNAAVPPGDYNVGIVCTRTPVGGTQEFGGVWNRVITITHAGDSWTWGPKEPTALPEAPEAPVIDTVTPDDGVVSVVFTPSPTGTTPTLFIATATDGIDTFTSTGTSSPIALTGLTNGTEYTVTVVARNANGESPASASQSVTAGAVVQQGVPDAPTLDAATPDDESITVSFTPATTGGTPSAFVATASDGTTSLTATGAESPLEITGLTNGTEYTVTVVARNDDGDSAASNSQAVTPRADAQTAPPGAPVIDTVAPGDREATVTFTAANTGGVSATFDVTLTDGTDTFTSSSASSPVTVRGLTNGIEYTVTLTASNAAGTSATSNELKVTPQGAETPSLDSVTSRNGSLLVAFTPATGSTATSYEVIATPSSGSDTTPVTATGTGSPITVTGLTNGTAYDVVVVAINGSARSAASTSTAATPSATSGGGTSGGSTTGSTTTSSSSTTGGSAQVQGNTTTRSTIPNTGTSYTAPLAMSAVLLLIVGRIIVLLGRSPNPSRDAT